MLVLTEIKLIFSMVASMNLEVRFVLETRLITQDGFIIAEQGLHRTKRPFLLLTHPTSEETEGAQVVGRGHTRCS